MFKTLLENVYFKISSEHLILSLRRRSYVCVQLDLKKKCILFEKELSQFEVLISFFYVSIFCKDLKRHGTKNEIFH